MTEDLDGGEYLFAIRMLMVLFRREFSFLDALYLWEVMTLPVHIQTFCISFLGSWFYLLWLFTKPEDLAVCLLSSFFFAFSAVWVMRITWDGLWLQLMWAMEYNPTMFATYEELENRNNAASDPKLLKRYGKFERKYINSGQNEQHRNTLAVFVVASVLQTKNKRLLKEAKGLDDVVQVCLFIFSLVSLKAKKEKTNSGTSSLSWFADTRRHCG